MILTFIVLYLLINIIAFGFRVCVMLILLPFKLLLRLCFELLFLPLRLIMLPIRLFRRE